MGQVQACFVPFGDSINLEQDRCTVCVERTIGLEIILMHLMLLQGDVVQMDTRFDAFGDSVNLNAR
jgi:hypothetical protein